MRPSQNKRLLQRLRQANGGYVFNYEIANEMKILKYTNRISELRAKGHDIEAKEFRELGQGVWGYRLRRIPVQLGFL